MYMLFIYDPLALACAVAGLAPGQGGPQASQPAKLQVLIVTGQNTASHDWRATTPMLRKILEDSGRFEVRVTEEFRGAGADTLAPYDVVMVNYHENKRANLRWGDAADNALLNAVRGGKGLVMYHFSLAAFEGWTAASGILRQALVVMKQQSGLFLFRIADLKAGGQ